MTASDGHGYEVFEGADGLAQLRSDWESLEVTGADHFFQTHAYLELWQRTIGDSTGAKPILITLREHGRIVGIFPACRVRDSGLPMLTWLGGPQTLDYGDVLFDADLAETPLDQFVSDSLRLLSGHAHGAVLYLPNVRDDARAIEPLRSRLRVFRESAAPYVPIRGTWDEYVSSLKRSVRRNLSRRQRDLAEHGRVEYELLGPADPDALQAMSRLVDFKRARHDAPGTRTNLFDEHYVRFRREQASAYQHSRVATLRLDGTLIAATLHVTFRNRLYSLVTGFDQEYAAYSPGFLLEAYSVRVCFENGCDPCDFCWGDEAHKYQWTDSDAKLTTFVSGDAKGAMFSAAAAGRRRASQLLDGLRQKRPKASPEA